MRRIRGVVRVAEEPLVIDDQAAGCRSGCVGIAVFLALYLRIYIRQELRDRLRYRVGPAEGTHETLLLKRILLLILAALLHLDLIREEWPVAHISPVRIFCEDLVRAQDLIVVILKNILCIPGVARPVHETARLHCGRIEVLETDMLGHFSHDRLILFRIHVSVQRSDESVAWAVRLMLMGRVDRPGIRSLELHRLHEVGRSEVQIKSDQAPALYRVGLPAAAF